jgi:hypothetical protein
MVMSDGQRRKARAMGAMDEPDPVRRQRGEFVAFEWPVDDATAEYHSDGQAPCRRCGTLTVPIVYGMPCPEMVEAEDRGQIVLGGCILGLQGGFTHACPRCSAAMSGW